MPEKTVNANPSDAGVVSINPQRACQQCSVGLYSGVLLCSQVDVPREECRQKDELGPSTAACLRPPALD
jgi:hypothetical protein